MASLLKATKKRQAASEQQRASVRVYIVKTRQVGKLVYEGQTIDDAAAFVAEFNRREALRRTGNIAVIDEHRVV